MNVADHARLPCVTILVVAVLCFTTKQLYAQSAQTERSSRPYTAQHSDRERPQAIHDAVLVPDSDYSDVLALSYVLGVPLLGTAITFGLSRFNAGDVTVWHVLGGVIGAGLAPAVVHWWNEQTTRGIRALLLLPSLITAGTVIMTLLTYGVLTLANTPARDPEDVYTHREVVSLAVGVIGGLAALVAWTLFDVQDSATPPRRSRPVFVSTLQVAIVPTEHGAEGFFRCRF